MKKINPFLLILISVFFISSCASMKLVNYEAVNPKVLYETDFSQDDGMFRLLSNVKEVGIAEIENGELHLKANNTDIGRMANLKMPFGNNSVTSFKIKLGKTITQRHPNSHINFFTPIITSPDLRTRYCIMIGENGIGTFTNLNGNHVSDSWLKKNFSINKWYDVSVSIQDYDLKLFIDGNLAIEKELNNKLPVKGYLIFECHQEYWIDDLKVVEVDTFDLPE